MTIKKVLIQLAVVFGMGAVTAVSATLPDDEYLAELYEYSCMACHASEHSGAPMAGDFKAWDPRVEKGLEQLLTNTIDGFRGMPALGSCSDCTAEDFEGLIIFMSGMSEDEQ